MKFFIYSFINKFYSSIKFCLLVVLSILLYHPITMAAWTKLNTPVIQYAANRWDNYHTTNPFVLFDNNLYKTWYTGNGGSGWKIGYGTSFNGINWQLNTTSIINPSGNWEREITQAVIRHENSAYKAWYSTLTTGYAKLGYATSTDGVTNWVKNPNPVFEGNPGKWDLRVADRGISILNINDLYHLWYAASDSGVHWRIGYATSPDGIVWTRHSENPVIYKTKDWEYENMMVPFVLYEDGVFKMWYGTGPGDSPTRYAYAESTNGYDWAKPIYKNPVYDVTHVNGDFDSTALGGLSIIHEGNQYKVWYAGFDGTHASIGYATMSAAVATPTPTPIEPVVIVPGTMASWNKEGILEGQQNPSTPWKLLPFVKEYDGLVATLKNLGYQEGKNLFLWPYDWRKSVDTISQQFNQYLDTVVKPQNPGSKIQLVGHSLGGLVTRTWSQTGANKDLVNHVVTVATPHKGTIQSYKPWEGGDVSQENSFLSLAARIIIELNRDLFSSTRLAVQTQFPLLRDLLPIESYLKRQSNNTLIDETGMFVRNTWLTNLNAGASSIFPILETIKGIGFSQTPSMLSVSPPTWIDSVLGNWQDGKPVSQETADGDTVVTSARTSLDDPATSLPQNHSNTIASADGVKAILQKLDIPYTDASVVPGQATTIEPGLLFLLRSPATVKVVYNGQTYNDFDGIIFIPGASGGSYQATVTGTGTGVYRLAIGQFAPGSFTWKEYMGNATPGSQATYTLPYSQTTPIEDPVTNVTDLQRLQEIDLQLAELYKLFPNASITRARSDLKFGTTALARRDFYTLKAQLEQVLIDLSAIRKINPPVSVRQKSFVITEKLIDAFQAIFSKNISVIDQRTLDRLQTICNSETIRLSTLLQNKFNAGEEITLKTKTYVGAIEAKDRAGRTTAAERAKKYILLFQSQLLFREIGL